MKPKQQKTERAPEAERASVAGFVEGIGTVSAGLLSMLEEAGNAQQSEFLTPQDLYEQFRIPESTQKVWRWQTRHNTPHNPGLPFIKLRRKVLYRRKDILAWLYGQKVGA